MSSRKTAASDRPVAKYCRVRVPAASRLALSIQMMLPGFALVVASTGIPKFAYAGAPLPATANYALPAGALGPALAGFAARADLSLSYEPALVEGKQTAGLTGSYSVSDALNKLLAGSGLQAENRGERAFVILKSPSLPPPPAPVPTAAEQTGNAAVLPTLTVTGTSEAASDGFVPVNTTSATRTDTPISEIPQSIQAVTKDVLQSQQSQSVADALANVSGVTLEGQQNGSPGVIIRGLVAPVMVDGLTTGKGIGDPLALPIAGIESIEVLKGADSILSGVMNPGGIVNVVRKKPQADPLHQLTVQVGSYGDVLSSLDLTGAVTDDKRLQYRFIVSGEIAPENFGGYAGGRNLYIAPSVRWQSDGTSLIVGMEQNTTRITTTPFTLLTPSGPLERPSATPLAGYQDHTTENDTSVYYDFEQKLLPNWTFRSKGVYETFNSVSPIYSLEAYNVAGQAAQLPGAPVNSGLFQGTRTTFEEKEATIENSVLGKFSIGPVTQQVLAGYSYTRYTSQIAQTEGPTIVASLLDPQLPDINLGEGAYGPATTSYSDSLFLQDQVAFGPVHILGSIARGEAWANKKASQTAWTPNIGLVYQLTDSVAAYVNDQRSFDPQPGLKLDGGGLASPETGKSIEAGFKFNLLDDKLTATAAVFRASEMNAAVRDIATGFYELEPSDTSRGVELDVTGRVLPGLNLIGNYTYADYTVAGSGFSQLPKHQGSLWMTYDFQGERLQGWGVAGGVRVRTGYLASDSFTGPPGRMPGQMRTDASVYYRNARWTATFGVKNIFDNRLYGDYSEGDYVEVEPGRVFLLTGVYNF